MLIILTMLLIVMACCALAALIWLWRTLSWEVVDDDRLDYEIGKPGTAGSWLSGLGRQGWFAPKPPMLTYRRDSRGRFRRYRR